MTVSSIRAYKITVARSIGFTERVYVSRAAHSKIALDSADDDDDYDYDDQRVIVHSTERQ